MNSKTTPGLVVMRTPILIAVCLLTSCTTVRSSAGYVVTDTRNIEREPRETGGCFDEFCTIIQVTLLHHGHTIKARCQAFDPQNHCSEIEVGTSYNVTRSIHKRFADLLYLDHPKMTLAVEEEHE